MDPDLKRRLVTEEQLLSLLEFMRAHPELARGLSRGRRGKLMTVKVWNTCATKLNEMKDGAVKDGKGWSKYWCDWKYRVRRHALEIRVARDTNKLPPEGITPLAPVEQIIMAIIGDSSIEGVVVKTDPLLDEDSNEEEEPETNENEATNSQVYETKTKVIKRRRVSAAETNNQEESDDDEEDPGSPPQQRARVEQVEESDLKRRLVTKEQMLSLLEFMRAHPELARGLSRGRRGKLMTVEVWNTCATKLNEMKDGAVKDGKGWSKYWCDWKYRVRRHALEIRVARDTNKLPPEGITPLAPVEQIIMAIIGDSSIEGVVVKTDPLLDENSNEEEEEPETNDNEATNSQVYETRTKAIKRRRVSAAETNNQEDSDDVDEDEDDDDEEEPGTPSQQRASVEQEELDSEEDSTTQFLRLEKMQFENAKRIQQSICQISLEICKLTDIMGEIRDVLVKRLDHIL